MQSQIFEVLLAALVGGTWVAATTLAVKRLGSGAGGLIGGLPAESTVSYLFIAFNQSPEAASRAAYAYPIGLGFVFLYMLIYAILAERGFKIAFPIAIVTWLVLYAAGASVSLAQLIPPSLFVISIFLIGYYMLQVKLKLPYISGVPVKPSRMEPLRRAALGATVVGTAVTVSQLVGPLLGGVAAAFPGVLSITLYSTYQSGASKPEGIRLSRALMKPIIISATIVSYPYSLAVAWAYMALGLTTAIVVALLAAAICAGIAYRLMRRANYCACTLSASPCPDYEEHRRIKTVQEFREAKNQKVTDSTAQSNESTPSQSVESNNC